MAVKVDERIAERRREVRAERRRKRLRRTLSVAALLVVALVAFLIERSSLVALAEVRVVGTHRLSPDDIREAADLPLGTSTLRLRLRDAAERVESLPMVGSADAHRVDPLTVEIDVVERVPVVVARGGAGQRLIDEDGVVMAATSEPGLPVIDVGRARLPAVGDRVDALPALANAHAAFLGLRGPLRAEIAAYEATGPDELDLILADGVRVRFGRAVRIDEKVRALGAVLEDLGGTPVAVIDVRAPMTPTVSRHRPSSGS